MKRFLAIATVAASVVLAASVAPASRSSTSADCSLTRTGLIPLTDMGNRRYRGHRGGLYPGGVNRPPQKYLRSALAASKRVQPIDGKIVLLSLGMSNASDEFSAFKRSADRDPQKNSSLVVVDGAQDGFDSRRARSQPAFWNNVDQRLADAERDAGAGSGRLAEAGRRGRAAPIPERRARAPVGPPGDHQDHASPLSEREARLPLEPHVRRLRDHRPQSRAGGLRQRLRGSRSHPGADQRQAEGPTPPLGPVLWTDGLAGRSDGLVWTCEDVEEDGTHPSRSGIQKVVNLLTTFFKTDPTARRWYVARPL